MRAVPIKKLYKGVYDMPYHIDTTRNYSSQCIICNCGYKINSSNDLSSRSAYQAPSFLFFNSILIFVVSIPINFI
jgi:hypothetical protein